MNLPNLPNETLVYNNYNSNASQAAPSRRESLDYSQTSTPTTTLQNGGNIPYEPSSETSSYYHHLLSNEKFEFLKSLSVSFPTTSYSMNHLLPSTSTPLGHHYLTGAEKNEFTGPAERGNHVAGNGYGGVNPIYNEEVDVKPAYQTLEGYNLKHNMDSALFSNSPSMQNNTSPLPMQGSTQQSLAQKLVLAKINGSKYQVLSKPGRKRGSKGAIKTDQVQQDASNSEYRVVHSSNSTLPNYRVPAKHEGEEEDEDSDCSERLVVEPEYTPRTPHSSEFDRSQFEKTFQNYSMTTTPSRGKSNGNASGEGPIKKFPCDQCPKSFTLKQNLTYHINSIHLGVRIQCDLCAKSFAHKPNLIAHMASAHNGVRFKCDHCVKSFNQKPNLISHIKSVHEGIKYKCEECTKTFAQKQNLLSHVQAIHMGIKYTCEVCSKSYNQVTNLLSHMSTVHQAQKYKCPECGRLFAQEHTLRSHTISVHSGTRFTCRTCGDLFDSKRELNEHVTQNHPGVEIVRETRGRPRKSNNTTVTTTAGTGTGVGVPGVGAQQSSVAMPGPSLEREEEGESEEEYE